MARAASGTRTFRTGLPKSTIRRLLGTLIHRKIVRRSLNDDLYRANISLPFQNGRRPAQIDGWLVYGSFVGQAATEQLRESTAKSRDF